MSKLKIIDLLNRIAKGEEVPKKIKASGMTWTYEKGFSEYKNSNFQELIKYLDGYYNNFEIGLTYKAILNYEVEIIEEEKKIEKISLNIEGDIIYCENGETHRFNTNKQNRYLANKINELIDVINDMRDKE